MQLKDVLQKTTLFFKEKGIPSARLDTELLFAHALKWDRIRLYMQYEYPLSQAELETCRALVRRRAQGEPIAYILGSRDFYNHRFEVEPGVLIPRPETEQIVESCVEWAKSQESTNGTLRVADLGCGSGCIGLSILCELEDSRLLAIDRSPVAVQVTEKNARRLSVADRATVIEKPVEQLTGAEVNERLKGWVDAVVANPPYISPDDPEVETSVRKFEPGEALFSEESGLGHIRRWAHVAGEICRPGGFVMFEIGATQGTAAHRIFAEDGRFESIEIVKDLSQRERFIRCYRKREEI